MMARGGWHKLQICPSYHGFKETKEYHHGNIDTRQKFSKRIWNCIRICLFTPCFVQRPMPRRISPWSWLESNWSTVSSLPQGCFHRIRGGEGDTARGLRQDSKTKWFYLKFFFKMLGHSKSRYHKSVPRFLLEWSYQWQHKRNINLFDLKEIVSAHYSRLLPHKSYDQIIQNLSKGAIKTS